MTRDDRGAGTLLVVGVVCFAGLLICITLAAGQAMIARHRAQAAADLAALAAAASLEEGTGGTCTVAAGMASANGASVTGCSVSALGDVTVTVGIGVQVVVGRSLLPGLTSARGTARAGPEE